MNHRDELAALTELALTGNMRRAAETLGMSQSTLSDVIARLETAYGARLFERDRRGTHPTVYGRVVVQAAMQALRVMDEAHREISLIKGSARGRLAIGAEAGLIEPYLTEAIARSMERYPGLRFRLQALASEALVQELRDKRVDFFLGVQPDVPTSGLVLRELGLIRALPFVRPGHPLADGREHSLAAILGHAIVQGPSPRWFVRRIAEELRMESGAAARADAAVIVNDFGVVRAIVRETDAVGFTTAAMLHTEIASGGFVAVRTPGHQAALLDLPVLLGTLVDRSLPPAAEELLADLEAAVKRYAP
ncbi:MAG: LysR family transcriptional regulator [Gammaproteobacteria bacterium]|nr:LysR family transcriptional regulator [Gammaproteobacteria bacterium]